jgi:hypothetical protein
MIKNAGVVEVWNLWIWRKQQEALSDSTEKIDEQKSVISARMLA